MVGLLLLILVATAAIDSISGKNYTCDPNAACGCSPSSTVITSRIVGGEAAYNQTWNWMVSFQYLRGHACGASLLTPEYAVTAAHCINEYKDEIGSLSILVGTNYLNDTSSATIQRRSITKMTMHSGYNSATQLNDIAIIQFAPLNVSSSSKIRFICLPQENQDPFEVNSSLVAIGWGVTYDSYTAPASNYLQQVTVQAYSPSSDDCQQASVIDPTTQLCAGIHEGGKDTCQGDSGGPLMAFVNSRWVLAGLTSFGDGCAQAGKPGVYTRISSYIPFIKSQIGSQTTTTGSVVETTASATRATMPIAETTVPIVEPLSTTVETTPATIKSTIAIAETTTPIVDPLRTTVETTLATIKSTTAIAETTVPTVELTVSTVKTSTSSVPITVPTLITTPNEKTTATAGSITNGTMAMTTSQNSTKTMFGKNKGNVMETSVSISLLCVLSVTFSLLLF